MSTCRNNCSVGLMEAADTVVTRVLRRREHRSMTRSTEAWVVLLFVHGGIAEAVVITVYLRLVLVIVAVLVAATAVRVVFVIEKERASQPEAEHQGQRGRHRETQGERERAVRPKRCRLLNLFIGQQWCCAHPNPTRLAPSDRRCRGRKVSIKFEIQDVLVFAIVGVMFYLFLSTALWPQLERLSS